jgi:hypothetical protein
MASLFHDPQIEVRRISALLSQEGRQDWQAEESWHFFFPGRGRKT